MSNGGSPHNQTIREYAPKPDQNKEVPSKPEKQAAPKSGPAEKTKAASSTDTARA